MSPTLRGQRGLPTVLLHVGGQRKDVGGVLPQLGRDGEFTLSTTRQHETQHQNPVTPPGAVVVLRQRLPLFDVCHESVDAALIVNIHTRNLACYRTRNGFPTRRECLCGSSSTSPRRWPPSSPPGSGGAPLSRLPVPRFDGSIGRDYEEVGAFLGTSQSAGRAIHWSSCSPAGCRKRPHSANAEAAACPRHVPRHFEEPLKLICAVRFRARTSGRTACTQRLNRRYATGKSDVFSDKRRSRSALAGADRGEPAGNPWPARA